MQNKFTLAFVVMCVKLNLLLSMMLVSSCAEMQAPKTFPDMAGKIAPISLADYPHGFVQEVQGLKLDVKPNGIKGKDGYWSFRAGFTVSASGMHPVSFKFPVEKGEYWDSSGSYRLGVGKLDRSDRLPSLIIMQHTGGAHCCWRMKIVQPVGSRLVLIEMDEWDSGAFAEWFQNKNYDPPLRFPTDETGDGIADFMLRDDRFDYAYTSYASSSPPPMILNVKEGKRADVSSHSIYRGQFQKYAEAMKEGCDNGTKGKQFSNPHACLVYAASAARVGPEAYAKAKSVIANVGARAGQPFGSTCRYDGLGGCSDESWEKLPKLEDSVESQLHEWGYLPSK
jgi:hypothetical protein